MKLEIPGDIAITGQISGHGELYTVGYLREKIVGAFNNGKSVIYVPQANILESTELEIEGIEVKPVCDMYQVVEEIWRI
jgi:predicted ATP-dependent protease